METPNQSANNSLNQKPFTSRPPSGSNNTKQKKRDYVCDSVSIKRLITASIVGFLLGVLGIHDFMVKRQKAGIVHLILCVAAAIITPFCIFMAAMGSDAGPFMSISAKILANVVFYLPLSIVVFSYIWAVAESNNFLIIAKSKTTSAMEENNVVVLSEAEKEKIKRRHRDYIMVAFSIEGLIMGFIVILILSAIF